VKRNHAVAAPVRHNARAHDKVAVVYDHKHAEIYNAVEQNRLEHTVGDLLTLVGTDRPRVLDFGAGTGNLTAKFLARGCHVVAADVSSRSLALLQQKIGFVAQLSTTVLDGTDIPFVDHSFDVVACYSVLHHIPDYIHAVREFARVVRPGGLIYIDHEANEMSWSGSAELMEYRRLSIAEHVRLLYRTRELFSFEFAKTVFMKAFINRRYEREGDLHVWPDDHIEWKKIFHAWAPLGIEVLRSSDYLLYQPRGGLDLYARYSALCTDTKYVFARKMPQSQPTG
jgi:ubiquinone/menaquinone biosynthesis C-methylase UbiE